MAAVARAPEPRPLQEPQVGDEHPKLKTGPQAKVPGTAAPWRRRQSRRLWFWRGRDGSLLRGGALSASTCEGTLPVGRSAILGDPWLSNQRASRPGPAVRHVRGCPSRAGLSMRPPPGPGLGAGVAPLQLTALHTHVHGALLRGASRGGGCTARIRRTWEEPRTSPRPARRPGGDGKRRRPAFGAGFATAGHLLLDLLWFVFAEVTLTPDGLLSPPNAKNLCQKRD